MRNEAMKHLIFAAALASVVALATPDAAAQLQQPTPEQVQSLVAENARSNACVDAFRNYIATSNALAEARQQIAALTKERDEARAKPEIKK